MNEIKVALLGLGTVGSGVVKVLETHGREMQERAGCRLRLHSTRVVQHIFGAIQEYGGFDEPRWLDGPPRRRPTPGA